MTRFLFVLINQAKYYAQDTGNQYSILGRLICLPDCDKTSENEIYISSPFSNQGLPAVTSDEFLVLINWLYIKKTVMLCYAEAVVVNHGE